MCVCVCVCVVVSQIKNKASMEGDVRLVPFHDFNDVMKSVKSYVNDFNSLEVDRIFHPKVVTLPYVLQNLLHLPLWLSPSSL